MGAREEERCSRGEVVAVAMRRCLGVWSIASPHTRRSGGGLSTVHRNRCATHQPFHSPPFPLRLIATSTSTSAAAYLTSVLAPWEQHRCLHAPVPTQRHRSEDHVVWARPAPVDGEHVHPPSSLTEDRPVGGARHRLTEEELAPKQQREHLPRSTSAGGDTIKIVMGGAVRDRQAFGGSCDGGGQRQHRRLWIQEASVSHQITGWKEHPEFSRSLCRSLFQAAFGPKS
jgi:hypothetical protein